MEGQVVLPGLERLARGERSEPGDRAGLPDDEPVHLTEPGGVEEGGPVEPRRLAAELGAGPVIVGLGDVARGLAILGMAGAHIGETFEGVVTGAMQKGTFVRLFSPPADGRVVRGEKGLDVGDRVRVRLLSTEPERGFIDFARA